MATFKNGEKNGIQKKILWKWSNKDGKFYIRMGRKMVLLNNIQIKEY